MAFNVFLFSRNSEMNETNQRLNDDIDFAIKQMNDKADE